MSDENLHIEMDSVLVPIIQKHSIAVQETLRAAYTEALAVSRNPDADWKSNEAISVMTQALAVGLVEITATVMEAKEVCEHKAYSAALADVNLRATHFITTTIAKLDPGSETAQ